MKIVYNRLGLCLSLVAALTTGCNLDVLDPGADNPIDIALDFCSDQTPIWFAQQNSSEPFKVLTPDASGTYNFKATARTAIAYVRQNGADYKTDVIFTSNLDLQLLSGLACLEEAGTKQVNGSVTGLSGSDLGLVGMSFASVFLTSDQTNFTLTQLVDRPLDLLASRVSVIGSEQHAIKTVIRRSQTLVNGATLSPINLITDGFVPVTNTATVSGIGAEAAFLDNTFFSQLETSHTLSFVDAIGDGVTSFVTIPAAELAAGDYHDLFAIAVGTVGSRGVERFFRNPANQTLAIGPALAEPLVTIVASTPTVSLRTQIVGQEDYSTSMNLQFHQQTNFASRDVEMTVTASYFGGTPLEWNLPTPNFSGLPGWQNTWGLQSPSTISWTVTAYFGRPQLLFGAKPNDGETVQFASRSSSFSAAQLFRTNHEFPRPRHFSRLR